MRVLHVLRAYKLPRAPETEYAGGLTCAALEIARAQACLGHDVTVACLSPQSWESEWKGVRLVGLRPARWARVRVPGGSADLTHHFPYMLYTHRHPFDVVHDHTSGYMRFLRARVRVLQMHADPFFPGSEAEGFDLKAEDFGAILRHTDICVGVSRFVAGEMERGLGYRRRVPVVYNGVHAELFSAERWQEARTELRQRLRLGSDGVAFLFAGAINWVKGVLPLAQAFVQLLSEAPAVHLIVAGSADFWGSALTEDHGRSTFARDVHELLAPAISAGRVHLLGTVPRREMPGVYAACDVVAVPSLWREAFGLVALEAMAGSRPVIASRVGGLAEVVSERAGLLVEPGNHGELAMAMRCLAENGPLREKLGHAGSQLAKDFSWEASALRLDDIYRSCLAGASVRDDRA